MGLATIATAQNINTIAGNAGGPDGGFGGNGGPADSTILLGPRSVTLDPVRKRYFICDQRIGIVWVVDSNNLATVYAGKVNGSGNPVYGGLATDAIMNNPVNMTVDNDGNLYIAVASDGVILRVDNVTHIITIFAGRGLHVGDGWLATEVSLNDPTSVWFDGVSKFYIAEQGANVIRVIDMTTGIIGTFAGSGWQGNAGDGGLAIDAQFYFPQFVRVFHGEVYIVDCFNGRICKVDSFAIITTILSGLSYPTSIDFDAAGNMYIANQGANVIEKMDPLGNVTIVAGNGTAAFYGDGGPAVDASLSGPEGITSDSVGYLYISDFSNHRIRGVTQCLLSTRDTTTTHYAIAFTERTLDSVFVSVHRDTSQTTGTHVLITTIDSSFVYTWITTETIDTTQLVYTTSSCDSLTTLSAYPNTVTVITQHDTVIVGVTFVVTPLTTGIEEPAETPTTINVYPNPFNDKLNVDLSDASRDETTTLVLIDNRGRIISETKSSGHTTLQPTITPGIYFLRILSSKGALSKTFQIIKQ